MILDLDGDEGVLIAVETNLTLDVFGFVELEGSLSFKQATGSFVLTDASTGAVDTTSLANVKYMQVGGHVESAFAGVGDLGFELTGVDFGMVMVSASGSEGAAGVSYMALKADVESASFVGIEGLTATVSSLSVEINNTSDTTTSPNKVLDFHDSEDNGDDGDASSFTISTGAASDAVILDLDGDEGVLIAVETNLTLDVFGFVELEGSLSFKQATGSFVLTDASTGAVDTTSLANVKYMQVGGHVESAFAGVGDLGFELTGVDFGMVMVSASGSEGAAGVSYMALKADVESASFVGIEGLTATVSSLSVEINNTSDTTTSPNKVLDFHDSEDNGDDGDASSFTISTGAASDAVILDLDGDEGVLIAVETNLTLDVFGFVELEGSLSFKQATGSFVLTDASTGAVDTTSLANVKYMQVGGHVESAFAGVGDLGFELTGVDFGMVMVSASGSEGAAGVSYMALKADVESASFVGIEGLTATVSSLSVEINNTSDTTTSPNKVLDFHDSEDNGDDGDASSFTISTGAASDAVILDLDGDEGVLIAVETNLTLDVFGFVELEGSLSFKQATGSFVLTDASTGAVDTTSLANVKYMQVGGHVESAFAGVGDLGFELTGVDFGMVMVSASGSEGAAGVSYMALKADVESASFVGIEGLTATVSSLSVEINNTSDTTTSPNKVLDFHDSEDNGDDGDASSFTISTGAASDAVILDLDGDEGVLIAVETNLTLDVFGFVELEGSLSFKQATGSFVLTDASTGAVDTTSLANVKYMQVGGHVESAFAGVGDLGFELTGVDFGMVMVSASGSEGAAGVSYMALKADVESASFVGIEGLTATVSSLSVEINNTSDTTTSPNKVLDFHDSEDNGDDGDASSFTISTGAASDAVILDLDGDEGVLIAVETNLTLDVFGFVELEGSLSFKQATGSFVLTDASTGAVDTTSLANVKYMQVGGHVESAFAGVGDLGFELTGVDFGMVMVSASGSEGAAGVSYMALKADVESASFVGIEGLTATVSSLSVEINNTSDTTTSPNKVLDFHDSEDNGDDGDASSFTISTGAASDAVILDLDGDEGVLIAVETNLTLDVFGFVELEGSLSFKQATGSFVLTDASTGAVDTTSLANVKYMQVGGHVESAFAGVGDLGFELTGVDFGMVMVSASGSEGAAGVSYMALKADVESASFVGIEGLTATVSSLSVEINNTSDTTTSPNKVLDFHDSEDNGDDGDASSFTISTGAASDAVILDLDGDEGVLIAVETAIELDLFGFFSVEGEFAFKKSSATVRVGSGDTAETVAVDVLTVGASGVDAFAGVNGGSDDALGLALSDANFALALISDKTTPARKWTAVKADVGSVAFVGIDAITVAAADISVNINTAERDSDAVIDFAAAPLTVATSTDSEVSLEFDGTEGAVIEVNIGRATLAISDYIYVSGGFYLKKSSSMEVDVVTGLPATYPATLDPTLRAGLSKVQGMSADHSRIEDLEVATIALSASDVDIFVGLGPYFNDTNGNGLFDADEEENSDAWGFELEDIDLGMVFMDSTLAADPDSVIPKLYAMQVLWPDPLDIDWDYFKFDVDGLQVDLNRGGTWRGTGGFSSPFVDFSTSFEEGGLSIPTGGDPIVIDYDRAVIGVSIQHALLNVADFFQIEGSFAFEKSYGMQVDVVTGLPSSPTTETAALLARLAPLKASGYLSADNSRLENLPVDAMSFGASGVTITVGDPEDPFFELADIDVGFSVMRATKAVDPSRVIPKMYAVKAFWPDPLDVDWGFMQLDVDDLTVQVNQGSNWQGLKISPHVDFISSFGDDGLEIATGGDPIMIDFANSMIGVEIGHALISLGDFFYLEGGFALEKSGTMAVDVATGFSNTDPQGATALSSLVANGYVISGQYSRINSLPMSGFSLGFSDVNLFVGAGPYFVDSDGDGDVDGDDVRDPDAVGLVVEDLDIGLTILKDPNKVVPTLWALSASVDEIALVGVDFLTLSVEGATVQANCGGAWSGTQVVPCVDFVSSFGGDGLEVATGGDPVFLDFTSRYIGVEISRATLAVYEFVYLSGSFAFSKGGSTELTVNAGLLGDVTGVKADSMEIGAENVQAFVGVYGPYRTDTNGDGKVDSEDEVNDDAIGLVIDDFDFGMAILRTKKPDLTGNPLAYLVPEGTKFTALKAHGEQIAFVGFGDFIEFSFDDVNVGLNMSSRDGLIVDFTDGGTSAGYEVATGGDPVRLDFDTAIIEASVAKATANVAGIVSLEGGFAFQKRTIENVGFNVPGLEIVAQGDALVVAGKDIYAFAGINGPYRTDTNGDGVINDDDPANDDAIGLAIDNLNFALAMVSPAAAPGLEIPGVKFYSLAATADYAGIVGTDPFLTLNATDLIFKLNGAALGGYPAPGFYIDYGEMDGGQLEIPIGSDGDVQTLDFTGNTLRIGLDANIGIFDIITINAGFDFEFTLPDTGGLFPTIDLSGVGDLIPDMSGAPEFLQSAVEYVKNLQIAIGYEPGVGLKLTGSLELPDFSLTLGKFVHIQGDFKLNLGQSFSGSMNTGLPSEVSLVKDLLEAAIGDTAASVLDGILGLAGISDDFKRIDGITFKGLTFGAKDVYVFVGYGTPEYEEIPGQDRKLRVANADDIYGFGMEGVDVGLAVLKADLPSFCKASNFYSFYAHADAVTTYGFGDVFTVRAQDITVEVNQGGDLFGGVMSSRADYAASFPADPDAGTPEGFEIETGGTPVYIDFTGEKLIGLDIGLAEVQVSEFLYVRGSFAFRKGDRYDVDVDLGFLSRIFSEAGELAIGGYQPGQASIPLEIQSMTFGGSNLTGFVGINGPYRYGSDADNDGLPDNINDCAVGLVIDDVDFGLAIMTPTLAGLIPGAESVTPKFLTVKAYVGYAGLVGIDEDFLEIRAEDVEVNINTFYLPTDPTGGYLNAALQLLGPPSINYQTSFPDSPEDANGNGILDTYDEDANDNGLLDHGEDLDGDGILDVTEDLDGDGELALNGFALPAGGNNAVILDFDSEIIQAKVGYAQINLAGFIQLSASMAFTKRSGEPVTLSNGETTSVTSLAIGINDANGFIGIPSDVDGDGTLEGYFYDSTGDGRIDESDETNPGAIGLAIEDLDVGIIVAAEISFGLTGVDIGVYLAAQADIEMIGLVGIDGLSMEVNNLQLDINVGARFSLDIGEITRDEETGAVSYEADPSVSVSLTTIDFSKSTWTDPDDVVHEGYAIETGNPYEPIVLTYDSMYIRVAGQAYINAFDLLYLNGFFEFKLTTEPEFELTVFADVAISIGGKPVSKGGNPVLNFEATGLLVVNSGGLGIYLDLSGGVDFASVLVIEAEFQLYMNTSGEEYVYEVPEEFLYDPVENPEGLTYETLTITAGPPQVDGSEGEAGFYLVVKGKGTMSLVEAFVFEGDFYFQISEESFQLMVNAKIEFGGLGELKASAALMIFYGEEQGVAGSLLLSGTLGIGPLQIQGLITLDVNTMDTEKTVSRYTYNEETEEVSDQPELYALAPGTVEVYIKGKMDLVVFKFDLEGRMIAKADYFYLSIDAKADFFGVVTIEMGGFIDSRGYFDIYGGVDFGLDLFIIKLEGGIQFEFANTEAGTELHYADSTSGGLVIFGRIYGSLSICIDMGFFSIEETLAGFDASLEITERSVTANIAVTIVGISVSASKTWSWGPEPDIASLVVVNGTRVVVLHMGDESMRALRGEDYKDDTKETFTIDALGDVTDKALGTKDISVTAMGVTEEFENVDVIYAHGGSDDDYIAVKSMYIRCTLDISGGQGDDTIHVYGAGEGSVVYGGPVEFATVTDSSVTFEKVTSGGDNETEAAGAVKIGGDTIAITAKDTGSAMNGYDLVLTPVESPCNDSGSIVDADHKTITLEVAEDGSTTVADIVSLINSTSEFEAELTEGDGGSRWFERTYTVVTAGGSTTKQAECEVSLGDDLIVVTAVESGSSWNEYSLVLEAVGSPENTAIIDQDNKTITVQIAADGSTTVDEIISAIGNSGVFTAELDYSDDDVIVGGAGSPYVVGEGDEAVTITPPTPVYYLGSGDDFFIGGDGADEVHAESGINTINTLGGDDLVFIEGGEITASGSGTIVLGEGDDTVTIRGGRYTIRGDEGRDQLNVLQGVHTVDGGLGDDEITLDKGNITIIGGGGDDIAYLTVDSGDPLVLTDHQFQTSGISVYVTDSLEMLHVTDTSAETVAVSDHQSGVSDWGAAGLTVDASGRIDMSNAPFVAPGGHLALYGQGIIGQGADNILAMEVYALTVINTGTGIYSDIIVREVDDLQIAANYQENGGLYTIYGKIDVRLATADALLFHRSGVITNCTSGKDIRLIADDVEFWAGEGSISGTGKFILQSFSPDQVYKIGEAAQSVYGDDYSNGGPDGSLDFSMQDAAALADGFTLLQFGSAGTSSTMYVGSLQEKLFEDFLKYQVDDDGVPICDVFGQRQTYNEDTTLNATLKDDALFLAERINVVGNVQTEEDLRMVADLVEINRMNINDPMGEADSGVEAQRVYFEVAEQMIVSGWVKGRDLVDIDILDTDGMDAMLTYPLGPNSLTADKGSVITSLNDGSSVEIDTGGSVRIATILQAQGENSTVSVNAGTGFVLLEGGMVVVRETGSSIYLNSGDYMHINSGSAVTAGAVYEDETKTWTDIKAGTSLTLNSGGELYLAGAVTAAGELNLVYTAAQFDHAEYFDSLLDKTLAEIEATPELLSALQAGDKEGLQALFAENSSLALDFALATLTVVENYTSFDELTKAQRDEIAISLGYEAIDGPSFYKVEAADGVCLVTEFTQGVIPDYANSEIDWGDAGDPGEGVGFEDLSFAQKQAVASHFGYTAYEGPVYYNPDADLDERIVTTFNNGPEADYSNSDIVWGDLPAPADDTSFEDLTDAQKTRVAEQLGYEYSSVTKAYYNFNAPSGEIVKTTFVQGEGVSYTHDQIYWGEAVAEPSPDTPFADLTPEQQERVAVSLGYQVIDAQAVFYNPEAVADERIKTGFIEGTTAADYSNTDYDWWGGVPAPETGTAFSDMTSGQQEAVAEFLGYFSFDGDVFFNPNADEAFRENFIDGVDYQIDELDWEAADLSEPANGTAICRFDPGAETVRGRFHGLCLVSGRCLQEQLLSL